MMLTIGQRVINVSTKSMHRGKVGVITEIYGDQKNYTLVHVEYPDTKVIGRHPIESIKPYITMLPEGLFEL